ncbi:MAG: hypothetical protein ACT4OZ_17035 [Gemmatimonadota bacterium]
MDETSTSEELSTVGTAMLARGSRRRISRFSAVLSCAMIASCENWSGPALVGPFVAVTGLDHGQVVFVDVGRRRVVNKRGPSLRGQAYPALSFDSTTIYYAGFDSALGPRIVVTALDVVRNKVLWARVTRSDPYLVTGAGAGVRFTVRPTWLTATADTGELLWYPAWAGDSKGVARYRPGVDSVAGFLPIHLAAVHTRVLRGRSTFPRGSLVVCGTRRVSVRPRSDALFIIGPDLRVLDSIPLPPTGFEPYEVAVTPDERFAFVKAPPFVFKVDLTTRQVVGQVTNDTFGSMVLSPAGDLLVVTDAGIALDFPGSGTISLFSASLAARGTIDLKPLYHGGQSPTTWDVAITPDGTEGIVVAGTPPITLGQGVRQASLLVVDLVRQRVVSHITLNEYGTGSIFMVR